MTGLRKGETARVVDLLDTGHRLVSITGLGGIGKSALALEVIDELRREHPEIEFSVLSVRPGDGASIRERLLDNIGFFPRNPGHDESPAIENPERRIIVIDGGENFLDHAPILEDVLGDVPGLQLLVTCRVPLGLPLEVTVSLRGLETVAGGDAMKMFLSIAEEHAVEVVQADRSRAREIVSRLGGYPLAIRLYATQLQTHSLTALHERMVDRAPKPGQVMGTDPGLREVIEWTLDRQSVQALKLLKLLAVFGGWSTLDSIEGVAAEVDRRSGHSPRRTAGMTLWLAELIEAGLVDVEEAPALDDDIRLYRVHDSVGEVAGEYRMADEIPRSTLSEAHRKWFVSSASEIASASATRRELKAYERLQAELSEYLSALNATTETNPLAVLQIVNQLSEFWITRGRIRSGARLLRHALRQLGEDEDGLGTGDLNAVLAQSLLSYMRVRVGAPLDAAGYQAWLWERLQVVFDPSAEATKEHFTLAVHFIYVAMVNSDYAPALRLGERCRDRAVNAGDDFYAGLFDFYLARVSEQAGDVDAAVEHIERAIVHVRRTQNETFLARCVSQSILLKQDELSPAALVEALKPLPEIHLKNRSFKDAALISPPLVIAYFRAGENAEALALLRRTLALSNRIHFFDGQLYSVVLIAFSELSAESTPQNIERCARLYGAIRPYLKRFDAVTAPGYQHMLQGGINGLRLMLGKAALDRITANSPTSWSEVIAEADAFAAEQQATMLGGAPDSAADPKGELKADKDARAATVMAELNSRERELLELVLTGITDKQIANRLGLKPNTVRSYNSRIFRKFSVASRTELLALFRRV